MADAAQGLSAHGSSVELPVLRAFDASVRSGVAELVLDVFRADGSSSVPPVCDAAGWFGHGSAYARLVAVQKGRVVGCVELAPVEGSVAAAFEGCGLDPRSFACVAGIMVHPELAPSGARETLVAGAVELSWGLGLRPVMQVDPDDNGSSPAAGWTDAGVVAVVAGDGGRTGDGCGVSMRVLLAPEPSRLETDLVHAGVRDNGIGAVATGIEVSTTFSMEEPGAPREFDYARSQNPTRKALEEALAKAEAGGHAMAFSSGLAAIDAVLRLLNPGERVMIGEDAYGGTWRLLDKVWSRHGVGVDVVDLTDLGKVERAWTAKTRMLMLESPSNPLLQVFDIEALAAMVHGFDGLLVVDNTFATPYLQQPLTMGADVVVHSATKYLGGHSDVVAGALVTRDDDLAKEFVFTQKAVGAVPGPFDSFLVLRGMRTLAVRVERQSRTAFDLARMLESHPAVARVHYPGLVSHPQHALAARQMRAFGGMLSVSLEGGHDAAVAMVKTTEVLTLAESLGAVESLIEYPASMTHAANAGSVLAVDPALVRISVGLEDPWVLARDLRQALDRLV